MELEVFEAVVEGQIAACRSMLINKGEEYAPIDRLHNFKQAAQLQGVTLREALGGMMVKHTVSIYDMITSRSRFSDSQWDEKITDHICYLMLLKAVLIEERVEQGPDAIDAGQ